jgi:hypothetical protein
MIAAPGPQGPKPREASSLGLGWRWSRFSGIKQRMNHEQNTVADQLPVVNAF